MKDREQRFCDEYLIDNKPSRAFIAAGYGAKNADANAYKMLLKPHIAEYIKAEQDKTSNKLRITRESVLEDLQEIKDNTKNTNPQAALKAIDLTIKMLGFNEPIKTETKVIGDVNVNKLFGFDD